MTDISQYHVFTDGTDWIIGTSLDEARTSYAEQIGENPEDYIGGDWKRLDDDAPLKVTDYDGQGNSLTQTCAEWIEQHLTTQRFFDRLICSTEY